MAKKFLTLDIGAANIALAEYESSGKGAPTLVNYGTAHLAAPIDSGDVATILGPAIGEIVRDKGIKPGPVLISVPGQMVFPRFAAIPAAGGAEKFEQMVRYEIEQNMPFSLDEMVCDRQVLGDTPGGDKSVMIVAAKTEQIEAITDSVSGAGFRPEVVDVAPIALTNAVKAATGEEGCIVILDIGAKTTSLVIAEGENIYNRSIPIAGNNITREIAQALGCSTDEAEQLKVEKGYVSLGGVAEDEDEVADRISKVCRAMMTRLQAEISRSVNFYRSQQGGGAPVRMYLTGGTALLPQVDQFFAEALQVEVAFFNPFDYIQVGGALDAEAIGSDGALIASTVGLAMRAAGMAHLAINLLPQSVLDSRAEQARIPVLAAAGAGIVIALVLVLLSVNREGAAIGVAVEGGDGDGNVVQGVQSKLTELRSFANSVKTKEEEVEKAKVAAENARKLMASRTDTLSRVRAVRESLEPGMWIDKWATGRITVRGWKDRLKDGGKKTPEVVVGKLRANSVVVADSVKVTDLSYLGAQKQILQFTLELKFK